MPMPPIALLVFVLQSLAPSFAAFAVFFFEIAFAVVGRSGEFVVSHATIRASAEGRAG